MMLHALQYSWQDSVYTQEFWAKIGLAHFRKLTTLSLGVSPLYIDLNKYDIGEIIASINIPNTVQKVIFEFGPYNDHSPSSKFAASWSKMEDTLAKLPKLESVHFKIFTSYKDIFATWQQMFMRSLTGVIHPFEFYMIR